MRHQLRRLAGGWLALHLSIVGCVPALLGMSTPGIEPRAECTCPPGECTCSHGADGLCRRSHGHTSEVPGMCSCRGTDTDPVVALPFGTAAILTAPIRTLVPPGLSAPVRTYAPHVAGFFIDPDSPPPRI